MLFNYELNRRFHAVHRNGPSKLQKYGEKSAITIEIYTKNEKKAFKRRKNHHFIAFFTAFQTSDIIASIFFSISLIFNLIQIRATFLCYRIVHFLNLNKSESFCKRLAEKHARSPENEAQKAIFTPSEWQKWEGKWGFSAWKIRKFRNILTDLFNTKTSWRGRAWKTRRESVALKDTILRKYSFYQQTIYYCLSIR